MGREKKEKLGRCALKHFIKTCKHCGDPRTSPANRNRTEKQWRHWQEQKILWCCRFALARRFLPWDRQVAFLSFGSCNSTGRGGANFNGWLTTKNRMIDGGSSGSAKWEREREKKWTVEEIYSADRKYLRFSSQLIWHIKFPKWSEMPSEWDVFSIRTFLLFPIGAIPDGGETTPPPCRTPCTTPLDPHDRDWLNFDLEYI